MATQRQESLAGGLDTSVIPWKEEAMTSMWQPARCRQLKKIETMQPREDPYPQQIPCQGPIRSVRV